MNPPAPHQEAVDGRSLRVRPPRKAMKINTANGRRPLRVRRPKPAAMVKRCVQHEALTSSRGSGEFIVTRQLVTHQAIGLASTSAPLFVHFARVQRVLADVCCANFTSGGGMLRPLPWKEH